MHKRIETVSTPIRFWSNGNMARTAFNRIENLRSINRSEEARAMLDEWIIERPTKPIKLFATDET